MSAMDVCRTPPAGPVTPRSRSAWERLPLSGAAALRAGLGELRHTASTGSTNDDLAAEARRGDRSPAVLVADHQTAGKGRLGRRWSDAAAGPHTAGQPPAGPHTATGPGAAEASLLVSFRLVAAPAEAFDRSAAVSAAALAAVSAVLAGGGAAVRSKWPNDLLIDSPNASGKLAGVLSEIVDGDPALVVVGLGLNLGAAPAVPGAVSLAAAGGDATRDGLLAALIDRLGGYLADPGKARGDLRAASATLGRLVRVQRTDGTSVVGTAADIDEAGRLVVAGDEGEILIDAGDVFHLR